MPRKKASRAKRAGRAIGSGLRQWLGIPTKKEKAAKAKAEKAARAKEQRDRERADLKVFRNVISRARKLGLVDKSVDARKATRSDPNLSRVYNKYATDLLNNAVAVKAPKDLVQKARREGIATHKNKIIVPRGNGARDRVTVKGKKIIKTSRAPSGAKLETEFTLQRPKGLQEFLEKNKKRLKQNERDNPNSWYAFRVMGHPSYEIFGSFDAMAAYLEKYVTRLEDDLDDLLDEGMLEITTMKGGTEVRQDWRRNAQERKRARHERQNAKNARRKARTLSKRERMKGRQ